jgi:hypothetical protein
MGRGRPRWRGGGGDVLPQVRAAALTNYIEVAKFCGLDPYRMLRRARINAAILTDPDDRSPPMSSAGCSRLRPVNRAAARSAC